MDAKYKAYGRDAVPTPDLHQLLTYIAGYSNASTPTAAILHPQRGDHTHRVLNVAGPRGLLGTIHVVGIDTRVTPARAATWVSEHWESFTKARRDRDTSTASSTI
jgi:5-methylcytosine-specific restriction enzyme subunit McrC